MHPKSTYGLVYPIPNCLHMQPENLPIASSFGSADSSPNILPPWKDAECLWSVEEGSECKKAGRQEDVKDVEKQKGCRPIDEKTQKERKRDREEQKDYVFSCIWVSELEKEKREEKERQRKRRRRNRRREKNCSLPSPLEHFEAKIRRSKSTTWQVSKQQATPSDVL